eukprot:c20486_g1_i1.p1 GENE.c20486_g1_i1~~c20486_g1_i1.p1  ORF type:complete len:394 (-),score=66.62 c20486_g1_i1:83-1222(-)
MALSEALLDLLIVFGIGVFIGLVQVSIVPVGDSLLPFTSKAGSVSVRPPSTRMPSLSPPPSAKGTSSHSPIASAPSDSLFPSRPATLRESTLFPDPSQHNNNEVGVKVSEVTTPSRIPAQELPRKRLVASPQSPNVGDELSVCVPCRASDIPALPKLLESISRSTVIPGEVVIAISELPDDRVDETQRQLQQAFTNLTIRIVGTPAKQAAGTNRNAAAQVAKGSVLSFFDADDEMHPQRLQIVFEAIREYNVKCIIHSYTMVANNRNTRWNWHRAIKTRGLTIYEEVLEMDAANEIQDVGHGLGLYVHQNNHGPHHGHPTCQSFVLREVQFTAHERGQDARFLRQVLRYYGPDDSTMLLIDLPLTIYHPSELAKLESSN